MTSAEHHMVIRAPHGGMVRVEDAPETGGAALVLAPGVEVLLRPGDTDAAAYLTRLASAVATARGRLHRPV
ncbi:hypothetical protein J0910_03665 [Nocardiopsis sp. CNT-189]|uniref:hypothetical protein n=1 Tax=Nocardiopsis oceanisediminis TaxID=2816862 RepID=UPI003B3093B7